MSIPRASYDYDERADRNRKAHIGFRDNQARTDDFHHVKVTLYRWVISLPYPHLRRGPTNQEIRTYHPERSRNSTPLSYYSWTTWSQAFFSHYYDNNGRIWILLSAEPILSKRVFPTDPSHNIWFCGIRAFFPISIEQVLHGHEEDFVQHVWFDLTLVRKELNIVLFETRKQTEPSKDDTDQTVLLAPEIFSFPKELELPSVNISFPFPFISSDVFPHLSETSVEKRDKFLFLGTHTRSITTKRIMVTLCNR